VSPMLRAGAVSFAICAVLTPVLIPILRRLRYGQRIRPQGPERHRAKAGTPTMGGMAIVLAALPAATALGGLGARSVAALIVTAGYAALGFADDYLKVAARRPLGLRARYKLAVQLLLGLGLAFAALGPLGGSASVAVPFSGLEIDLGAAYPLFALLVLVGSTNAVNLTDGLDGLAAGLSTIGLGAYALLAWSLGMNALAAFAAAFAGASAGFLLYNRHPARVFMGDTGSLALGAALASVAVLSGTELWLVVIGGVFVVETLSVIVQVAWFQMTGRRIFRMSPIHHHFELSGWSEPRVVLAFWAAGLALAAAALVGAGLLAG